MKLNFRNVDGGRGSLSHGITPLLIPSTTNGSLHPSQMASSPEHSAIHVATSGGGVQPNQNFQIPNPAPSRRCRPSLGTGILYLLCVIVILTLPIALPVAVSHAIRIMDWPSGTPIFPKPAASFTSQEGYYGANTSSQNHEQGQDGAVSAMPAPVSASNALQGQHPQASDPRPLSRSPARPQPFQTLHQPKIKPPPHQGAASLPASNPVLPTAATRNEKMSVPTADLVRADTAPSNPQGIQYNIGNPLNHAADIAEAAGYTSTAPVISQQEIGKTSNNSPEMSDTRNMAPNLAAFQNRNSGPPSDGSGIEASHFIPSKELTAQHESSIPLKYVSETERGELTEPLAKSSQEQDGRLVENSSYGSAVSGGDIRRSNPIRAQDERDVRTEAHGQAIKYSANMRNLGPASVDGSEPKKLKMEETSQAAERTRDKWGKYVVVRHGNLYLSETFESRLNEEVARRIYGKYPKIFGEIEQDCVGKEEVSFSFKASPRIRAELEIVTRCGDGGSSCTIKSEVDDLRRLHVNVGPGNRGEHFLRADATVESGSVSWGPLEGPLKVRLDESSMVLLRRVCAGERGSAWRVLSVGQIKHILREIEEAEGRVGRGESGLFDMFRYEAHPHEHIGRESDGVMRGW